MWNGLSLVLRAVGAVGDTLVPIHADDRPGASTCQNAAQEESVEDQHHQRAADRTSDIILLALFQSNLSFV